MGGGSGPSTNPTRLVPFEQEQDGATKSCISITGPDIIRLGQNPDDIAGNFNPLMINRTGDGYMIILEKIDDGVAENEQEIIILTVSTGSPYKQLYRTAVGTSGSPYIRIQKGSLKNSETTEQNLKGNSFYEFTAAVNQQVKELNIQTGLNDYTFDLIATTKYFLDIFGTESSFILTEAAPTEKTASQSGRIMNVGAVDDSETLTVSADVIGGTSVKEDIRAIYEMNPITFTTTEEEKKQCVISQFSDAKADPSISFYEGDEYGKNSLANTFNYSDSIETDPTFDGGFWNRKDLVEKQTISFQIDARENVAIDAPLGIKTEYPNLGLYQTQTATLVGAPTLDSKICGGTVLTATDFVKFEKVGDDVVPVKDKNEVVVAVSTIAMSGAGEASCQTGDGIKFTWDENGLTVTLPEDDN